MSKFTKGPWAADDFANYIYIFEANEPNMMIAQIRGWGYLTGKGGLGLSDGEAYEIQKANARLIAAAPEMYEMITKLVDGITIAELLNVMQVVKVNPVLIESAKRLLARIDGKEEHHE